MGNENGGVGKYCPFNGFNPPCRSCMLAVRCYGNILACSIPIMATREMDVNCILIENCIEDERGERADEDEGADERA